LANSLQGTNPPGSERLRILLPTVGIGIKIKQTRIKIKIKIKIKTKKINKKWHKNQSKLE